MRWEEVDLDYGNTDWCCLCNGKVTTGHPPLLSQLYQVKSWDLICGQCFRSVCESIIEDQLIDNSIK